MLLKPLVNKVTRWATLSIKALMNMIMNIIYRYGYLNGGRQVLEEHTNHFHASMTDSEAQRLITVTVGEIWLKNK